MLKLVLDGIMSTLGTYLMLALEFILLLVMVWWEWLVMYGSMFVSQSHEWFRFYV